MNVSAIGNNPYANKAEAAGTLAYKQRPEAAGTLAFGSGETAGSLASTNGVGGTFNAIA